MWQQTKITLAAYPRGFHLVTNDIQQQIPEIKTYQIGLAHIFLLHTSASLCLNENADPDVRTDLENFFNRTIPDHMNYHHCQEGPDDMPAHIKAIVIGNSFIIPITKGKLALGTWQGIYLCEHKNHGGRRSLIVTLSGQCKNS